MKITNEARDIIQEALKEQNCDSIALTIKESEHGYGLAMELVSKKDADRVIDVNGVNVVMDMDTEVALLATTFGAENGELVLQNEGGCGSGGCAGCSGCH